MVGGGWNSVFVSVLSVFVWVLSRKKEERRKKGKGCETAD